MSTNRTRILTGWKWVHVLDGELKSLSEHGQSTVIYGELEWATPQEDSGPLCVFKRRKDSRIFEGPHDTMPLYKCKYVPSNEDKVWRRSGFKTLLKDLPDGTVLAKAVKLIRKEK